LVSHNPEEMEKAIAEMEIQKAWDLENEMKQILSQLKITDLSAKMGNFRVDKSNVLLWRNYSQKPERNTLILC
jgi:hypothetical protein